MYCGLEYKVKHSSLMTNTGLLDVSDVHTTWLHVQKLYHQVNILLIH